MLHVFVPLSLSHTHTTSHHSPLISFLHQASIIVGGGGGGGASSTGLKTVG